LAKARIFMKRMIPADRLGRPDNFITMSVEKMRAIRAEQGLTGVIVTLDEEALRARLHTIYTGELQAMEAAGRTLFDFPDAPWEFQLEMARQVWDESRHTEIFGRLVEYMGAVPGDYVETDLLWRCTLTDDPAARVAGINRGLEGLACDVFEHLIRIAQKNGDSIIEKAVDYVLADEITHVRMGSKWMRKLTEGNPERLAAALAFQDGLDMELNYRGRRRARTLERTTMAWSRSPANPGSLQASPRKKFRDSSSRHAAAPLTSSNIEIFSGELFEMSHARFVQGWLEGWNTRDVDRIMAHYDEAATFQSPSVLALQPASNGVVSGRVRSIRLAGNSER
jgi:hypothetical protein